MHTVKLQGATSLEELVNQLQITDPASCSRRLQWFIDLSDGALEIDSHDVQSLSSSLASYRERTSCADETCRVGVLASDPVTFGYTRMLLAYLTGIADLFVSTSREEVFDWLLSEPNDPYYETYDSVA